MEGNPNKVVERNCATFAAACSTLLQRLEYPQHMGFNRPQNHNILWTTDGESRFISSSKKG